MIKIIDDKDIEYTHGDTFSLTVYPKEEGFFEPGMQLRFVIAKTEQSEHLIDKRFDISEDLTFVLTLTETEKAKLNIGNYRYKYITYKNNTIVTQMSGLFDVKWGA